YFMEAAAIISLISVGHWIEARVSERAGGALKSLLNLAPQTARRIQNSKLEVKNLEGRPVNLKTLPFSKSAIESEVPVSELKTGDRIALRPGDRVPVDGVVLEDESAVDEAMLTGESVPAEKKSGSELFAGTVNLNGRLVMRVTATGEGTALAHIIAAVQRAQTSRADIQRLGDRISNVFVPVIVIVALAAGLWWGLAPTSANHVHDWLSSFLWRAHAPAGAAAGFVIAAAILIVACPCAMGLATPAAIMASANTAAKRGILIRDGVALEKAGEVTAVIFDKTGTITAGKPEVAASWSSRGRREESLTPAGLTENKLETSHVVSYEENTLAASLARHSTHPISRAIAKISADKVAVTDWQEIRGAGIEANIQHSTFNIQRPTGKVRLGSLNWLRECDVDLAAGGKFTAEWSQQGATIVGLASDKTLLGLFAVRDAVKMNAKLVVEQLMQQGLKTYLLTGDNSLTAASIAKQVGIAAEKVFAEVRPEQKADFVKKLQAQGERVAFVGDGINDAPALTQADLGIAVSRASDVAREAADIILLKSEIEAVPEALGLARATLRTIRQNLFWAFFYNALGVPLAAMGFISPIFCAAAMGFSDLIVIGNALRLLRWRN
ncbi:MAG TPA: heavy metal translocating P-type ATPase, partial [Verrucomicrobiae bacterium]